MATQDKSSNIDQLTTYVRQSEYIDVLEQPKICKSFGLPYLVNIFREEYRQRFYEYLKQHTTTAATVSKATGIPHKYCCEIKYYFEKKKLLQVVYLDRCSTTGSQNVQYLSTNPEVWNDKTIVPQSNKPSTFEPWKK
ncbi:MAG: hypothetical protein ACON5F_02300 [Jejuia sp.]